MLARTTRTIALVTSLLMPGERALAQTRLAPIRSWLEATAGSEVEAYLRALELDTALAASFPQTIRGFSRRQLGRMTRSSAHPWSAKLAAVPRDDTVSFRLLRPSAQLIGNSGFPFGINDGAVWAGRGLTTVLRAGAIAALGPLTIRLEPVAFRAENNGFPLFDNGRVGADRFRDPISSTSIDLPQRFGDGAYGRVDLGESEVRVDVAGLSFGVSNAAQTWGPAVTHPLILGPNAPGFVHSFVETVRPVPVFIGRVHARLIAGRLDQSAYSETRDPFAIRTASGVVVTLLPRALDGLEVGGIRFFHSRWHGWSDLANGLKTPLTGFLLKSGHFEADDPENPAYVPDNQLASLFLRWAFPRAGFEFYGEFGRNDAAVDLRDLLLEPDHDTGYLLGLRHLVHRSGGRLAVVRGEWANARVTHLNRVRPQTSFYTHGTFTQGHTNRGQVLGSLAILGGSGFNLGADLYSATGRTSVDVHRFGRLIEDREGADSSGRIDIQHAIAVERSIFVRGLDVFGGLTAVWELNRNFRRDAFNAGATIGVRVGAPTAVRVPH